MADTNWRRRLGALAARWPPQAHAITLEEARKIAAEQTAQLAGPPRKIDDITQRLDQARPDPIKVQQLKAIADASVPAVLHGMELADFYYKRAVGHPSAPTGAP